VAPVAQWARLMEQLRPPGALEQILRVAPIRRSAANAFARGGELSGAWYVA
jgi:hypothetical protein